MLNICPDCNEEFSSTAKFCPSCGYDNDAVSINYKINDIMLHFNGKYSPGYHYIPVEEKKLPIILLCHGKVKEGKDSKLILSIADYLAINGFVVFTFDNLCFNKAWKPNEGEIHSPEETDMRWATFAAITYIRKCYNGKRIILIGHSMGAAISLSVGALSDYISEIIAISPARTIEYVYDDDKLKSHHKFIMQNDVLNAKYDINVTRSTNFDIMIENYFPLLSKKDILFLCGDKESYLKNWIKYAYEAIGEKCKSIIIPNAGHFYGTYPEDEKQEVFNNLANSILMWINDKYV